MFEVAAGWKVIVDNFQLRIEGDGINHDAVGRAMGQVGVPGFWEGPVGAVGGAGAAAGVSAVEVPGVSARGVRAGGRRADRSVVTDGERMKLLGEEWVFKGRAVTCSDGVSRALTIPKDSKREVMWVIREIRARGAGASTACPEEIIGGCARGIQGDSATEPPESSPDGEGDGSEWSEDLDP